MNKVLTNKQRENYKGVISELFQLCPDMMSRKIPEANVQQAFILDTVRKLCNENKETSILAVGSFEDTALEALIKTGYCNFVAIDPAVNESLDTYFKRSDEKFDIIFSTSVIEHVQDDELFIDQICKLLNVGGHCTLTCDFRNDYKEGNGKPGEDFRLYTKNDLLVRLHKILESNNCSLVSEPDYDHEPDFVYGIYTYSFATYTFKKNA